MRLVHGVLHCRWRNECTVSSAVIGVSGFGCICLDMQLVHPVSEQEAQIISSVITKARQAVAGGKQRHKSQIWCWLFEF